MNHFKYKVITSSGNIESGIIKLPYQNVMSAITHLERDGKFAIYVKKIGFFFSFIIKLSRFGLRKRLKRTEQVEMFNNLSLMLKSGVSLTTALKETTEEMNASNVASDIDDIIKAIEGGTTFSAAAAKYRYIFPRTVIYLIKIGEETGQLDTMLKNASEHLKKIQTIISDTKQALLYPAFVFSALGAGFLFWFYYVVPKIVSLFKEMDVSLPKLTLFVMGVSSFIQNYIIHILLSLAFVFILITSARKKSRGFRKILDGIFLKTPVAGGIIYASNLAYITEYLSLLINAGIDVLRSISILKETLQNEIYRDKISEIEENLKKGEGVADSFKKAKVFPPFVTRMINIGEISGTLTNQLDYIAEEYKQKLSIMVATIGKSIEPIVLVIAGIMFAIIIGGLMLPIYDLVSGISG